MPRIALASSTTDLRTRIVDLSALPGPTVLIALGAAEQAARDARSSSPRIRALTVLDAHNDDLVASALAWLREL